jgi:hypothetical protein
MLLIIMLIRGFMVQHQTSPTLTKFEESIRSDVKNTSNKMLQQKSYMYHEYWFTRSVELLSSLCILRNIHIMNIQIICLQDLQGSSLQSCRASWPAVLGRSPAPRVGTAITPSCAHAADRELASALALLLLSCWLCTLKLQSKSWYITTVFRS